MSVFIHAASRTSAPARNPGARPRLVPGAPAGAVTSSSRVRLSAVLTTPAVEESTQVREEERTALDTPWQVVVWDDPVNLMSWVTWVFRTYFGYPQHKAQALMMEVHTKGRAVVAAGSLEEAEKHVAALHGYGLWATYERAGGSGDAAPGPTDGGR